MKGTSKSKQIPPQEMPNKPNQVENGAPCPGFFSCYSKEKEKGDKEAIFSLNVSLNPNSKEPLECFHFAGFVIKDNSAFKALSSCPWRFDFSSVLTDDEAPKKKEGTKENRIQVYINGDLYESPPFKVHPPTDESDPVEANEWGRNFFLVNKAKENFCLFCSKMEQPKAKRARTESMSNGGTSEESESSSSGEEEEANGHSSPPNNWPPPQRSNHSPNGYHSHSPHQNTPSSYAHNNNNQSRVSPPPSTPTSSAPPAKPQEESRNTKHFNFHCVPHENGKYTVISEQDFHMELIDSEDIRTSVPPGRKANVVPEGNLFIKIAGNSLSSLPPKLAHETASAPTIKSEGRENPDPRTLILSHHPQVPKEKEEEIFASLSEQELLAIARVLLPELNPSSIAATTSPFVRFCSIELLRLKAAVVELRLKASVFTGIEMKEEIPTELEMQQQYQQFQRQYQIQQAKQSQRMAPNNQRSYPSPPPPSSAPPPGYNQAPPSHPPHTPHNSYPTPSLPNNIVRSNNNNAPSPSSSNAKPKVMPKLPGSMNPPSSKILPPQMPTAADKNALLPLIHIENVANEQILNRCLQSRLHEGKGKTKNSTPQVIIPHNLADQYLHKGSIRCYLISSPPHEPESPTTMMTCDRVQRIIKSRCIMQMKSLAINTNCLPLDGKFPARSDVPDINIKTGYFAVLANLCEGNTIIASGISEPFRLNVKMKQFKDAEAAAERRRRHKKANKPEDEEEEIPRMNVRFPYSTPDPYSKIPTPGSTQHIMSLPSLIPLQSTMVLQFS
eukprot:TRINITY_DN5756_c0_g1_i5.p1 TRINITY_DN5756_c0_g1~~TRINITY_DN5756_c0_g1_i5.p1  ORF type:complete len:784 (-),score=267.40 TRINITY_DN5756_c0_g1_i5:988-3339(-)